jgi:hypothetical protein
MTAGWFNEDYWMLCDDVKEAEQVTALYGIADYLPDHLIVGLKGWDDFILCNRKSQYFTIPTVPLDEQYLEPFEFPSTPMQLEADKNLAGKIKWYLTPIVFGGDPEARENMVWITPEKHAEFVRWWNDLYRQDDDEGRQG